MIEEFPIRRELLQRIITYLAARPWGEVNDMLAELKVGVDKVEADRRAQQSNGAGDERPIAPN